MEPLPTQQEVFECMGLFFGLVGPLPLTRGQPKADRMHTSAMPQATNSFGRIPAVTSPDFLKPLEQVLG